MTNKKIILVLLGVALLFTFSGCPIEGDPVSGDQFFPVEDISQLDGTWGYKGTIDPAEFFPGDEEDFDLSGAVSVSVDITIIIDTTAGTFTIDNSTITLSFFGEDGLFLFELLSIDPEPGYVVNPNNHTITISIDGETESFDEEDLAGFEISGDGNKLRIDLDNELSGLVLTKK